ncbi:MAG: hypothetical protein ACJAWS_001838 [Oleiphilaceae bacterium]|jgi:hypothetical protein
MKLKAKRKVQQADQTLSVKKLTTPLGCKWEMSAQDALRVDYKTKKLKL